LILSIANDIDDTSMTNADLQEWRACILSTVACVTKYESEDDLFWAACNIRESIGAQYEVIYYSTVPIMSALLLGLAPVDPESAVVCSHLEVCRLTAGRLSDACGCQRSIHLSVCLFDSCVLQVQRIFQLAAYKANQEEAGNNLSYDNLADLYNKRVRVSSGEEVSRYYVGQALRVYTHVLSNDECRLLILEARAPHCVKL
jgi:hypothetical protein